MKIELNAKMVALIGNVFLFAKIPNVGIGDGMSEESDPLFTHIPFVVPIDIPPDDIEEFCHEMMKVFAKYNKTGLDKGFTWPLKEDKKDEG